MKLWPYLMDLTIDARDRERPVRLWLPVFLLWPMLVTLALLAFVFTVPVDVVLALVGRPYHHYTLLVYRCFGMIAETRGLSVRVNADQSVIDMTLY